MSIIYSKTEPRGRKSYHVDYYELPATKFWLTHFANSLILSAIQRNPQDLHERIQATNELTICDRKMAYWAKHLNYNVDDATREATTLRKQWL